MEYVTTQLDRHTGDLKEISLGQYYTLSELAKQYGEGPRRFRSILHHMGFLQMEGRRYRLPHRLVAMGLGKRHDFPKSGKPFDVVSPKGQELIAQAWDSTESDYRLELEKTSGIPEATSALEHFRSSRPSPVKDHYQKEEEISFLEDFFPSLSHSDIASILGVTQQHVSSLVDKRKKNKEHWQALKRMTFKVEDIFQQDDASKLAA